MTNDVLRPGEMVVPLAGLVRMASILSGAVSGAIAEWLVRHWIVGSLGGLVLGGIAGAVVGSGVGRLLYPTAEGKVRVVKAGRAGLPATLKAAMAGAISSSLCVAAALSVRASPDQRPAVWLAGALVGVVIGIIWGAGATLA